MPKKKSVAKRSRPSTSSARAASTRAQDAFVRGVLVRGEAAKPSKAGKLPKDAEFAITSDENGSVTIKRHKLKLF